MYRNSRQTIIECIIHSFFSHLLAKFQRRITSHRNSLGILSIRRRGEGKGILSATGIFSPFQTSRRPYPLPSTLTLTGYFSTVGNLVSSFKMISLYEQLTDIDQSTTIPVYIYIYICTFEIFMISSLFIGMQRDNFRFI